MSHPHAPAIVMPDGRTYTLPHTDGHPDVFDVVVGEPACARWRYHLDAHQQVSRIEHAATPGLWTPYQVNISNRRI